MLTAPTPIHASNQGHNRNSATSRFAVPTHNVAIHSLPFGSQVAIDDGLYGLPPRFWAKVNRSGECWLWTAARDRRGYGLYFHEGKQQRATRVVWAATHGPIPDGMFACHHCDTPACIRLDHLYMGTHAENMADMSARRRTHNQRKTICPQGHSLSGTNLYVSPAGERNCRSCARQRLIEWRAKRRQTVAPHRVGFAQPHALSIANASQSCVCVSARPKVGAQ